MVSVVLFIIAVFRVQTDPEKPGKTVNFRGNSGKPKEKH